MSKIAEARQALGFTQSQMARALGLNQSTISRFENGELPVDQRTQLAVEAILSRTAKPEAAPPTTAAERRKVAA